MDLREGHVVITGGSRGMGVGFLAAVTPAHLPQWVANRML